MAGVGFLIRSGAIGVGAALLSCGAISLMGNKPPDPRPVSMTPAQALALRDDGALVSLDESIDPQTRVWETSLAVPRFVTHDTSRVHPYAPGDGLDPALMIGTTVTVDHALARERLECVSVREGPDGRLLRRARVLSPVQGTDLAVWVLSPRLEEAGSEADAWQARGSYRGAAGELAQLDTLAPDLGHTFKQIADHARTNLHLSIPPDAVVVLDGIGEDPAAAGLASLAAVEGTQGALLVRWVGQVPVGPIRGIASRVSPDDWKADASRLMGFDGATSGVVIDTTRVPAHAGAHDRSGAVASIVAGGTLLALGAGWTLRRLRSRVEQTTAHGKAISPGQAMALGIPFPGAPAPHQVRPTRSGTGIGTSTADANEVDPGVAMGDVESSTSDEDAALVAEMARWTSGNARGETGRQAA